MKILPRNRRIMLSSGAGILLRASQLLTSLITLPVLLHSLGLAGFGVWSAATSIAWLSYMLDLGLGSALVTLLPKCVADGAMDQARAYISAALFGGFFLSLGAILVAYFLIRITGYTPSEPFLIAGMAICLNIPLSIANEIWMGMQKSYVSSAWQFASNLLITSGLVLAAWFGGSVIKMTLIVYSVLLLTNCATLLNFFIVYPVLRPSWQIDWGSMRIMLTRGVQMFAITIAALCAFGFDTLLTLAWLGADAAGQISIAIRVCTTATGFIGVATQPLWPGFVDAIAVHDRRWLRRTLLQGTAMTAGLAVLGGGLIIVAGAPILHWWLHMDVALPANAYWIMAAWILMACLPHVPGLALHAALRLKPQILVLSSGAFLGIGLKYLLGNVFGVVGILVSYPIIGLALTVPAYFWLVKRWLTAYEWEI